MTIVVLAEKPSVARDIAAALGARQRHKGFLEGGGYQVTWALGHLVRLAEPHEINAEWKKWQRTQLPLIPTRWPLVVVKESREQFKLVKKLLCDPSVQSVVCATDAGREGELIFRYIYEKAACKKPIKRLWISSLTPSAIKAGFKNLKDSTAFDNLADSAKGRSRADWLVGMNLSRSYSLLGGEPVSVGRVQTPTLAMLAERERAIADFKAEEYFEVKALFDCHPPELRRHSDLSGRRLPASYYEGIYFDPRLAAAARVVKPDPQECGGKPPSVSSSNLGSEGSDSRLPLDRALIAAIKERARQGKAQVLSVSGKDMRIPPPLFYDLTELQRHANRLYGFSAQRTLDLAQSLYERHKLISYPRTDCRHLSNDLAATLPGIVAAIRKPYEGLLADDTGSRMLRAPYIDGQKVVEHHAIIPTGQHVPPGLPRDEGLIYDLICRRLLAAWHEPYLSATTTVVTVIKSSAPAAASAVEDHYRSKGTQVLQWGWKVLEQGLGGKKQGGPDEQQVVLPAQLTPGLEVGVVKAEHALKKTKPPPPMSEARLLTGMETAGATLEDKELSQAMRARGLGTPATRAQIIETLVRRGYVQRQGKALRVTDKGMRLIEVLHPDAKSPKMTGEWEAFLGRIERGEKNLAEFMSAITRYLEELVPLVFEGGGLEDSALPPGPPLSSHQRPKGPPMQQGALFFDKGPPSEPNVLGLRRGSLRTTSVKATSGDGPEDHHQPQVSTPGRKKKKAATSPRTPAVKKRTAATQEPRKASARKPEAGKAEAEKQTQETTVNHEEASVSSASSALLPSSPSSPSSAATLKASAYAIDGPAKAGLPTSNLRGLLQKYFGFSAFRPYQEEVCEQALRGQDLLVVMPTGAGKSLCYQVPGAARGGTTMIISPLIALMEDQVRKLQMLGFAAERIHSGRDRQDSRMVCRRYLDGELDFLYIAPERLGLPGFIDLLVKRMPSLIAIDEAHCISQWGHDFRADYRKLGERLRSFPGVPKLALTATASPQVQNDIVSQLQLATCQRFICGFRRTNIGIEVATIAVSERLAALTHFLDDPSHRPAIIYVATRKDAEAYAQGLARRHKVGSYHAGMSTELRQEVQEGFITGARDVMVATVAFGMGIDKSDVRAVVHLALPSSLAGYYQEIGRAGRDGQTAKAVLMFSLADQRTQMFLHELNYPPLEDLRRLWQQIPESGIARGYLQSGKHEADLDMHLQKLWVHGAIAYEHGGEYVYRQACRWEDSYQVQKNQRMAELQQMMAYADDHNMCRMVHLIRHFGDDNDPGHGCGLCDVCQPTESYFKKVREPNPRELEVMTTIVTLVTDKKSWSSGNLYKLIADYHDISREVFDVLVNCLVQAKYLEYEIASFTKNGHTIHYRQISLPHPSVRRKGKLTAEALQVIKPYALSAMGGRPGATSQGHPAPAGAPARRASARPARTLAPTSSSSDERRRTASTSFKRAKPRSVASTHEVIYTSIEEAEQNDPVSRELLTQLEHWRKAMARKEDIPAYCVLSNKTLQALAAVQPRSESELLEVTGIGPAKIKKYGREILTILGG